ncbi:b-cell receptor CD22 [Trichonephila clavipes]|nr:b-cell receptor CD22 [Trichonephila clavipes]
MQPTGGVIVNESDSAIIYCTYEANPFNVTDVQWFHEDQLLAVPTAGKYESTSQGYPTLTVRNVQKENRGMYSCALSNAVGRGNASNYAEVNVLFPPKVEATISPEDVKEGNSISLFCDIIEGNPQNLLRVRWFKEDELLHETTEREIVWVGVTRNSSGIYSCEGENAAGWGERSEERELIVNSKTAAHLFAMDAMRLSIRLWGILFHSSRSAISKSRTVAGGLGRAAMHRPSMSQTCSIGFRSGKHAGHSIRCIVSASSMFSTRRALWGRALSSWKTKESPMTPA